VSLSLAILLTSDLLEPMLDWVRGVAWLERLGCGVVRRGLRLYPCAVDEDACELPFKCDEVLFKCDEVLFLFDAVLFKCEGVG